MRKVLMVSTVSVILAFGAVFSPAAPAAATATPEIAVHLDAPIIVHTDGNNPVDH